MNLWLIIAFVKLKHEKNSGLNGIQTHDLCNTSAVLYQLRYIISSPLGATIMDKSVETLIFSKTNAFKLTIILFF